MAAVVGAPLGNLVLTQVAPEPMRWAISAIVLTAPWPCWRAAGASAAGRAGATTLVAGGLSGFLNGLSGMAGPPIIFYYLAGDETAERVRANLTTYFIFVDLVTLVVFAGRDLISWDTGVQALWLVPAVIAGGLLGQRLFPLASEKFYRRLALFLLVAVAIGSLIL